MNNLLHNIAPLIKFIIKPYYAVKSTSISFSHKALNILGLILIALIANSLLVLPANSGLIDASFDEEFTKNLIAKEGWLLFAILGVFVFPFFEELMFRYHLKSIIGSFIFYTLIITILCITFIIKFTSRENAAIFIFVLLCSVVVLTMILYPKLRTQFFHRLFIRHFSFHVWLSVFLFAMIHVFNYNFHSKSAILLSPILVLPQLLGGIILSYARLKYGLLSSMFIHAMNNLILLIIVYLSTPN